MLNVGRRTVQKARSVRTYGVPELSKPPYSIGKELAVWLERLFQAKIPADTLRKRAERQQEQLWTFVHNVPTNGNNEEIRKNKEIIKCSICGQLYDSSKWDDKISIGCPYCFKGYTADGEVRQRAEGGGRSPKYQAVSFTVKEPNCRAQGTG